MIAERNRVEVTRSGGTAVVQGNDHFPQGDVLWGVSVWQVP